MRRGLTTTVMMLLITAALPMAKAFAVDPVVTATPTTDTKVVGQTMTITGSITLSGSPQAGKKLNFKVTTGPNSGTPFIAGYPAGVFGECTTDATGTCQRQFLSAGIGQDLVVVWDDTPTNNHVVDMGESQSPTSTINWVASGDGTSKLRIDMQGCNGDVGAPIDETTWDAAGASTGVGLVHEVCASRFDSDNLPTPGPLTFTITSGPGHFTNAGGTSDLGITTVVQVTGNYNDVFLISTQSGTTVVKAEAEGLAVTGTTPWSSSVARIITLSAASPTVPPGGSIDITAHVTDRFGNDVFGVVVTFTEAGAGSFSGGISSINVTTGPTGFATATLFTASSDTGTNTVTGSLSPLSTDCGRIANDPPGAPAGACSASKTIGISTAGSLLTIGIVPDTGVWGTFFQVSGLLKAGAAPISGRTVQVFGRPVGSTTFVIVGITTTDGSGRYLVTPRPDRITDYKATFDGDPSFGPAASGTVTALVRVGVAFNQRAARIAHGSVAVFKGRVLPERPGTLVFLQAFIGGVWRNVRTARLDAHSEFVFTYVRNTAGRTLFRAAAPSNGLQLWNISRNLMQEWL